MDPFDYYPALRRVRAAVLSDFESPPNLREAAGIACMSVSQFCWFFKKRTGLTYGRWRARVQIAEACRLAEDQERAVDEIAALVGFGSTRTFQRHFRRLMGTTASEYQNALLEGMAHTNRDGCRGFRND